MIKAMSRVLLAAVFLVSMSGWSLAQQAKPEHPTATEQPKAPPAKPEHPTAKPEHPTTEKKKSVEKKMEQTKPEHPKSEEKK